jgi:peptidoglycan/LPS O-acetylase OafA/YrhL
MRYRPEVDGLRTIAVVPVILYHAGLEVFRGGYVGVDVFFVISGYLITTILLNEMDEGRFSLVNFYERRARRILPALFFVMACCVPFAWMWLRPEDLASFARSMVAVSLFASNILFWRESSYFAQGSELQPLLHTWSLAVEEQYYILFPLFLMLFWRTGRKVMLALLALVFVGSLVAAHWTALNKPSAAFYLLPFRAWELVIGVFVAFTLQRGPLPASAGIRQAGSGLGLGLIVYAVFGFDSETLFPGFPALVPTVGTGLVLLFAVEGTAVRRILANRLLVGIGLISYSAYLWHQPLFAFARYHLLAAIHHSVMLLLAALTFGLAYLSWRFVETPFRSKARVGRRTIFAASGVFASLAIASGLLIDIRGGFPAREYASTFAIAFHDYDPDNGALQDRSWADLRAKAGSERYGVSQNPFDRTAWFDPDDPRRKLLIVGNSHSKDLYSIISQSEYGEKDFQVARFGTEIREIGRQLYTSPNYRDADIVMIGAKYYRSDLEALPRVVERILRDGKRVAVVRSIFEFDEYRGGTLNLADITVLSMAKEGVDNPRLVASASNERHFEEYSSRDPDGAASDAVIADIAARHPDVVVLDRMDYACSTADEVCFSMDANLHKYIFDYGHNTVEGSAFFASRIEKIGWLDPLVARQAQGHASK